MISEQMYQLHRGNSALPNRMAVMKELANALPPAELGSDSIARDSLLRAKTLKDLQRVSQSTHSTRERRPYCLAVNCLAEFCCNATGSPSIEACVGAVTRLHNVDQVVSVGKRLADKIPQWQAKIDSV